MFVSFDELIGQGVNQQAADRHVPLVLPRAHHAAQRHEVAVAGIVARPDGFDFWPRVRRLPAAAAVCVRVGIAGLVVVEEAGHDFEGHVVVEVDDYDLSVAANVRRWICTLHRCAGRLQQCGLPVTLMRGVLMIESVRKLEQDVEITESVDGRVSPVGADIQAMSGIGRGVPEIGVQSLRDPLVADRDRRRVLHLQFRAEDAKPVREPHAPSLPQREAAIRKLKGTPVGLRGGLPRMTIIADVSTIPCPAQAVRWQRPSRSGRTARRAARRSGL
jgi:hypothetical protein